jgi:riboflavin transporter FmnP
MIVGEGLIGVLIAAIVAFNLFPIAIVGDEFAQPAKWIAGVAFIAVIFLLYRWTERTARRVG